MTATSLDRIRAAVRRRPDDLAALHAAGRKVVAWIGYNVPEEIIYACGLVPVRICRGGDARLAQTGANYISTQNCPFLRQTVGLFATGADPALATADAVVTDTTCLQLHRTMAAVRHHFGATVIQIGVPKNPRAAAGRDYFAHEVAHFAERLEELAGAPLDAARLRDTVALYAGIRRHVRELYAILAVGRAGLRWQEVAEVVQAGFVLDRDEYLSLLRDLVSELNAAGAAAPGAEARVFLAGSVLAAGDTKLVEIAESVGARVAGDLLWSGYAPFVDMEVATPTLPGVADAYLDRLPHAGMPCLEVDGDRRLTTLLRLVQQSGAHGVIYHSLRNCDAFGFKMLVTKEYLRNAGIPLLDLQTDYGALDTEAMRTRIEAFVEMLAMRI